MSSVNDSMILSSVEWQKFGDFALERQSVLGKRLAIQLFRITAAGIGGMGDGGRGERIADGRHALDAGIGPFGAPGQQIETEVFVRQTGRDEHDRIGLNALLAAGEGAGQRRFAGADRVQCRETAHRLRPFQAAASG